MAPTGGATTEQPKWPVIAGIAGSALALIGSFMTWTTASFSGDEEGIGGMEGDGVFTLITSAIALVLFAAGMVRKSEKLAAFSLLPTLVTLVFAVLNLLDPERLARADVEDEAGAEGLTGEQLDQLMAEFDFSTAIGLYLVLLGVLAALAGGAMAAMRSRSATQ